MTKQNAVTRAQDTLVYRMNKLSLNARARFNQLVSDYELTSTQWQILSLLHEQEGRTQTDVSLAMAIGKSSIGKSIDSLERRGWLRRETDTDDRRTKRLFLTDKATLSAEDLLGPVLEVEAGLARGLSADERRTLRSLLDRMLKNIDQADQA